MQEPSIHMHSTLKSRQVNVQWTVQQWHLMATKKIDLESKKFTLWDSPCFLLFDLSESGKAGILRIKISYKGTSKTDVVKPYATLVKNNGGERHVLKDVSKNYTHTSINEDGVHYNVYRFQVEEEVLNKNNVNLIFYIEFTHVYEVNEKNTSMDYYCSAKRLQQAILNDYDRMNRNEESLQQDNITFIINNDKIQVHSLILATASPYFSAMFRHENFKENKERTINLSEDNDVTLENFQLLLDLLYSRKNIQNVNVEFVSQICILADKYNIKDLVELCGFVLSSTITTNNVLELLLFAEKYNCEYLKNKASAYVKENITAVKHLPCFDDICKNKTLLLQII